MKDLLLAVPSRGRPQNIHRLWTAMDATCRGDTGLVVGLDEDDPARPEYPEGPFYVVRPGLHQVVAWTNELIMPRVDGYRYFGAMGDDNVPSTVGWDVRMMEALGKTPFAFGNDLYPLRPPGALCCHVFTRSEIIRALGYLGAPALRHSYVDDVWMAWGQATGITYLHDVIIEHLHYTAGKAVPDETYQRSATLMSSDQAAFSVYCRDELDADICKIRQVLR